MQTHRADGKNHTSGLAVGSKDLFAFDVSFAFIVLVFYLHQSPIRLLVLVAFKIDTCQVSQEASWQSVLFRLFVSCDTKLVRLNNLRKTPSKIPILHCPPNPPTNDNKNREKDCNHPINPDVMHHNLSARPRSYVRCITRLPIEHRHAKNSGYIRAWEKNCSDDSESFHGGAVSGCRNCHACC